MIMGRDPGGAVFCARSGRNDWRGAACVVIAACAALCLTAPVGAEEAAVIDLPSGARVSLFDVITNVPGQGLTYRFRFLAPHITGGVEFDLAERDMRFLCETYALPRLSVIGPRPAQIVITLLDRPVAFGEIAPEAIQFFEAYRPEDTTCYWEAF